MVDITDEIIEKLKLSDFTIPPKDIRGIFSTKKPVYPLIVVSEVLNTTKLQLYGEEKFSKIGYKFEVYTRDISHNGRLYTKDGASKIVLQDLDRALRTFFGMKRTTTSPAMLHGSDKSIYRRDVIYEGIINNDTQIIYQ